MDIERTVKLVLEYDGTRFSGWQVQPDRRTVQGVLEEALATILCHPVRVSAAGRTDTGVHAAGQVASFRTRDPVSLWKLVYALNGILPRDVTVLDACEAEHGFNARYDAVSRTYLYTITTRRMSIGRSYAWHVKYALSRELLMEATSPLYGACNLRGFSKSNENDDYSTIVLKNRWTFNEDLLIFEISAVRFFHHSVRSIVGSAVETARGKEKPDLIRRILETGDRSLAGPLAPAYGLCLVHVNFDKGKPA